MSRMPQNKKELITTIESEWALLMEAVEALSEEQLHTPDSGGWSPKDNLAHLAEWLKILMGHHMDKRPAHKAMRVSEAVARDWDMQVINPVLFERNKDRPYPEVMSRLKRMHRRLITRLKVIPFRRLMKPRYAEDPGRRPLLLWVLANTSRHFKEHRQAIQRRRQ